MAAVNVSRSLTNRKGVAETDSLDRAVTLASLRSNTSKLADFAEANLSLATFSVGFAETMEVERELRGQSRVAQELRDLAQLICDDVAKLVQAAT